MTKGVGTLDIDVLIKVQRYEAKFAVPQQPPGLRIHYQVLDAITPNNF